jgi:hypothetical protein
MYRLAVSSHGQQNGCAKGGGYEVGDSFHDLALDHQDNSPRQSRLVSANDGV